MRRLTLILIACGLMPVGLISSHALAISSTVGQRRAADLSDSEVRLALAINDVRAENGLWGLQLDPILEDVARARSVDQVSRRHISHVTPEGVTIFDLLDEAGITFVSAGENIAESTGIDPVQQAIDGFLQSPAHRANLLSASYDHVGVGAAETPDGITVLTVVFTN
ncbi:MAG: CAP domain-containing protein [Dehalococcoidia bacterium]